MNTSLSIDSDTLDCNTLHRHLLADVSSREIKLGANDDDADDADDDVLSQLLTASRNNEHRTWRCCWCPSNNPSQNTTPDQKFFAYSLITFILFLWMGIFSSIYSMYSCDIVQVDWNAGGVQLSVSGIGVWRFQQVVPIASITYDDSVTHYHKICVNYDSKANTRTQNGTDFFLVNHTLRMYSLLVPSICLGVFIGLLSLIITATFYHEKFVYATNTNEQYAWKTVTTCHVLLGTMLITAGTMQLMLVLQLMHHDDGNSPICNHEYSFCHIGPGGIVAIFGVICIFASALLGFTAAFTTIRLRR